MSPIDHDEVVFESTDYSYWCRVVFAAIAVLGPLGLALMDHKTATPGAKVLTVGIGLFAAGAVLFEAVRRVRVGDVAVTVERPGWKTVVRYADITSIEIQDVKLARGQEKEILVIKTRRGFPFKFRVDFEDGLIPVYSALLKHWGYWKAISPPISSR
jgi:hypothetical protein